MKMLCLCLLPLLSQAQPTATDTARLGQHLRYLTIRQPARSAAHPAVLDSVASYLARHLRAAGGRVARQLVPADGTTYQNVIASFGPEAGPRLIVGAHYDVCGEQPGADDNGTGTAALLELARLLGQSARPLPQRIDLVAYTLEEPPYFRTPHMGSYVHAASLRAAKIPVTGMVALEMLGYYDERRGSQRYPLGVLKLLYGSRGNYVTVAQKFGGSGRWGRRLARRYRASAGLPVRRFKAPAWLPGVNFSDHLNYWHFGYPALLLTDTAFYRNAHYHQSTDTLGRMSLPRLALAVDALRAALLP
ncbi:M28 family peptidase [Hymenobacter bucti]|uniref:M28 family peptidase n=1 Tax=Hymenobacter bucti TaxID=1844114 RepID=A0ABW4R0Y8_9BACT